MYFANMFHCVCKEDQKRQRGKEAPLTRTLLEFWDPDFDDWVEVTDDLEGFPRAVVVLANKTTSLDQGFLGFPSCIDLPGFTVTLPARTGR